MNSNLFIGVFPTGISYCDKSKQEFNDYKRIAFLSFSTLEFKVYDESSPLLEEARKDAESIQAMKGQPFAVDSCGHTITLGLNKKD